MNSALPLKLRTNLKICTYVMMTDSGLAPNPFWGTCTLAICTPNHTGARIDKGDWIAGFLSRRRGGGLVYAMKVDEILHFDEYYRDPRFRQKRPVKRGRWPKPVGDNMYYLEDGTRWMQHPTNFHTDSKNKDTTHPYVFISSDFYYFGINRPVLALPDPANALENYWLNRTVAQGLKYFRDSEYLSECNAFVDWLREYGPSMTCDEPLDGNMSAKSSYRGRPQKC